MNKNLAGIVFIWRGIEQDYCFIETISSLCEFCDHVFVLAGGNDDTCERLMYHGFDRDKVSVRKIMPEEWNAQHGREKLSYFQNQARDMAIREGYKWQFVLQADEIVHESCYDAILKVAETQEEAFYVKRINLWGSPYTALNVPQERQPVGTRIIRLARTFYPSVDDAESILAPASEQFMNDIRIYHMGFVRDKNKHLVKIKHIQEEVFGFEKADSRIDTMTDGFDPWVMFSRDDVSLVTERLPLIIESWAQERVNQ